MKRRMLLTLFVVCLTGLLFAQSADFEGILTTRVTMVGVDMSAITEHIDYSKDNLQEQVTELYKKIPAKDLSKMQTLMEKNPMMGFAMILTPPQATIYVKGKTAFAKIKGLGYEIQHYHNTLSDEAFIYTASLIQQDEEATAAYKPSQGYEALFTEDKRISPEKFNVERSSKVVNVAGYTCNSSIYTAKTLQANTTSSLGIPTVQIHKLVVYTSKDMPKGINFSHPFYLPEDHGIMRIDVYLDESAEPTMTYEMVSVKKTAVDDSLLVPKKTEPLYALTDLTYGMKVLGIMMGGMAVMDTGDHDAGDDDSDAE